MVSMQNWYMNTTINPSGNANLTTRQRSERAAWHAQLRQELGDRPRPRLRWGTRR